jgi:hypothetical protein
MIPAAGAYLQRPTSSWVAGFRGSWVQSGPAMTPRAFRFFEALLGEDVLGGQLETGGRNLSRAGKPAASGGLPGLRVGSAARKGGNRSPLVAIIGGWK